MVTVTYEEYTSATQRLIKNIEYVSLITKNSVTVIKVIAHVFFLLDLRITI
jgi:flagellar biogenesis protein FliO